MQLDLFNDRTVLLARARRSLETGQVGPARDDLGALLVRYPADSGLRDEATRLDALCNRILTLESTAQEARPGAILDLARELDVASRPFDRSLKCALLRRVARELLVIGGDTCELEGMPPGFFLLEAGAIGEAYDSLSAAVRVGRRARVLALLGDAACGLERHDESRAHYLDASLLDPYDFDFDGVRDPSVRDLPRVARYEFDIEEEPIAWTAPVGVLTSVLHAPSLIAPPFSEVCRASEECAATQSLSDALVRARAFLMAYYRARSPCVRREEVIEARREMKVLAPTLFAAYMDQLRARASVR